MLGIIACNAAIAGSFASPGVHAHRGFVHIVIINDLAAQHGGAVVPLAEEGCRVAPEVAAVGDHAAGEGVAGTSCLGTVAETVFGSGPEGIHA